MDIHVDCKPGIGGELEPAVVWFGRRGLSVLSILDRWYGRGRRWWKLDTEDGVYVLRLDEDTGKWDLAAVVRT